MTIINQQATGWDFGSRIVLATNLRKSGTMNF